MTGFLGRASAAALAAILMTAAPEAASAQRGGQQKAPQLRLSKPVQSLVAQAQKAQQGGDHAGALALLDQARALPNQNADDRYIIAMLSLNSALETKNNALIESSLEGAVASGKLPPEDVLKFQRNIGAMALQRNDYAKAAAVFEQLAAANPNDPQLLVEIAELQRRQNQNQKAVATLQQAIRVAEAGGQKADESWYRRALAIAYDSKLPAETVATSEALVRAYPNPVNWRDVLVIFRDSGRFDDQGNLDILRLLRANNALAGERDFVEYAETAAVRGLPGEAKAVLDEGLAKGALKPGSAVVRELTASVSPRIAADRNSLPGLEKEARGAANGRLALGLADAHLGYGNYAKAAEFYRLAIQKGGIDANTANTRLGLALGRSGDKAGAEAALKAVSGAPREQLARFMLIWLGQQAG